MQIIICEMNVCQGYEFKYISGYFQFGIWEWSLKGICFIMWWHWQPSSRPCIWLSPLWYDWTFQGVSLSSSSSSHQLKYWDAQLLKRPRNEKRRHDILLCQAIIVTFATNTILRFVWANWLGPVVIQFVGSVLRVTQLLYLLLKCECHLLILF